MAEPNTVTLTVDSSGKDRVFATPKEFHDWLQAEVGKWRWLEQARAQVGNIKPVMVTQLHPLGALLSQVSTASGDESAYFRQSMNAAIDISNRVNTRKLLTSEDPAGKFVLMLHEQGKTNLAAFALGYFIKASAVPTELVDEQFEGKFMAAAFSEGLRGGAAAEKAALAALAGEFRAAIDAHKLDAKTAVDQHTSLRDSLASDLEIAKNKFDETEKARKEAAEKALGSYEDRFEKLRASFVEHMKLQAPVRYWSTSARRHDWIAGIAGVLAIAWGVIVGVNVYNTTMDLIEKSHSAKNQDPPIWEVGLLLFLVTLAIWALRVLVRIFLSSLHQGTDARSRATMTEAYMALIEGGKALPEKDRILVLTTLFRPMSTGLIKDDGMPPTITELLSRIVGGKGTN